MHQNNLVGKSPTRAGHSGGGPGSGIEHLTLSASGIGFGQHRLHFGASNSFAKMAGNCAMTTQAQSPDVVEIALASAFLYGQNVICIPQALASPFFQAPVAHEGKATLAAGPFQPYLLANRIDSAMGANASIPFEDLLAQISGLGPQLPLVHAIV